MKFANYLSLVKFSHTIFSLPFAMIGFFLAATQPEYSFDWIKLFLVLFSVFFIRNAAMAFNRYADKEYDKLNPRTLIREIPSNIIKPRSALFFVIVNSILFFTATWFLNPLCFYLSPVALTVVLGYSYTKRFTWLCHLFLGLGLSLAPIGAYLAVAGEFSFIPVLFSIAVLFWVGGFDIIYALQDDDFDRQNNLKSIPAIIGRGWAIIVSIVFHLITIASILIAGNMVGLGIFYWIGAAAFIGLLFYQHVIVKPNDLSRVNLAFFTLNGIGSIVFSVFAITDLYLNY